MLSRAAVPRCSRRRGRAAASRYGVDPALADVGRHGLATAGAGLKGPCARWFRSPPVGRDCRSGERQEAVALERRVRHLHRRALWATTAGFRRRRRNAENTRRVSGARARRRKVRLYRYSYGWCWERGQQGRHEIGHPAVESGLFFELRSVWAYSASPSPSAIVPSWDGFVIGSNPGGRYPWTRSNTSSVSPTQGAGSTLPIRVSHRQMAVQAGDRAGQWQAGCRQRGSGASLDSCQSDDTGSQAPLEADRLGMYLGRMTPQALGT